MPAPRRSRRRKDQEEPQWQAVQWPTLKATWEGRSKADIDASHTRAQALVQQGYDPLMDWLLADPTPEELSVQQQGQLSVFDAA